MRKSKIIKSSTAGITLIALVITIVVLLILAGVSISMVLGDNGILTKAKTAENETRIAAIKEQIQIDIIVKQSENNGNISEDSLKEILEKYGTLSEEEKLTPDKTRKNSFDFVFLSPLTFKILFLGGLIKTSNSSSVSIFSTFALIVAKSLLKVISSLSFLIRFESSAQR